MAGSLLCKSSELPDYISNFVVWNNISNTHHVSTSVINSCQSVTLHTQPTSTYKPAGKQAVKVFQDEWQWQAHKDLLKVQYTICENQTL